MTFAGSSPDSSTPSFGALTTIFLRFPHLALAPAALIGAGMVATSSCPACGSAGAPSPSASPAMGNAGPPFPSPFCAWERGVAVKDDRGGGSIGCGDTGLKGASTSSILPKNEALQGGAARHSALARLLLLPPDQISSPVPLLSSPGSHSLQLFTTTTQKPQTEIKTQTAKQSRFLRNSNPGEVVSPGS